ncbi:ABC transporter substrate-binding protein [Desulfovibrio sulfodismutans]|uniref:ABC transporter substrate-binding protein n=2 Tax=Desulfolutivibrio sulfodismutans TaxID=63561 RepID=A0A7K3NPC9_9BACT|nr:ABC transporter substrate-binding protein [Desulfolutivibrio sulfodismutans]QLA14421.1 ABC transporter substrate-binding protein [Desulfolutivibrio sulfodismutans DSM 3696]
MCDFKRLSFLFAILVLLPATAWAETPKETLQRSVDQVILLLQDPAYKDTATKPVMREKLIKTVQGIFDAKELSRRALATNWDKFSANQQERFSEAFLTLLQNTYLDRIESYTDEKVNYLGEKMLAADRAEIPTIVNSKGRDIPITYRMLNANGWRVYDVVIEGVSLVQNYRNQFSQILMKESPDKLIDMLGKKS